MVGQHFRADRKTGSDSRPDHVQPFLQKGAIIPGQTFGNVTTVTGLGDNAEFSLDAVLFNGVAETVKESIGNRFYQRTAVLGGVGCMGLNYELKNIEDATSEDVAKASEIVEKFGIKVFNNKSK